MLPRSLDMFMRCSCTGARYTVAARRWQTRMLAAASPEAEQPGCLQSKRVASASVRDGISAAAVVFAPEYGSEDDHQIRSHICSGDCAGSTSPDSLASAAQTSGTNPGASLARDGKVGATLWTEPCRSGSEG